MPMEGTEQVLQFTAQNGLEGSIGQVALPVLGCAVIDQELDLGSKSFVVFLEFRQVQHAHFDLE